MPVEGHDRRGDPESVGLLAQEGEQVTMADMDPVVRADGDR